MPIYEYRCTDCGHRLEALQRLADAPLLVCPACGKECLTKLMSAVGFHLKGSGWYATDFKHSGSKPAEKGTAKPDAANEGASSAEKGESAPATPSSSDQKSETKTTAKPASSESKTTSSETKSSATTTPAKPAAPRS
jgi:putative FmdB family regulatory protein